MIKQSQKWHDDEKFWETFEDTLFSEDRIAQADAEVDQLIGLTAVDAPVSVLDMCCGVGRHSIELARRGHTVTAVDRTRGFLQSARSRARQAGVDVELVHSDIRTFCRSESYDLAINLFTSFGYFEDRDDDRLALKNIWASLRPGGQFVIDLMGKEVLAGIFREKNWDRLDDALLLQERRICDDWSWIENRWIKVTDD